MKNVKDQNPQVGRRIFEDNYELYASWCEQMYCENKEGEIELVLQPVSERQYMSIPLPTKD